MGSRQSKANSPVSKHQKPFHSTSTLQERAFHVRVYLQSETKFGLIWWPRCLSGRGGQAFQGNKELNENKTFMEIWETGDELQSQD